MRQPKKVAVKTNQIKQPWQTPQLSILDIPTSTQGGPMAMVVETAMSKPSS